MNPKTNRTNQTNLTKQIKPVSQPTEPITTLCQSQPAIIAAYLFGSQAKGTARRKSDIDVAILLEDQAIETFDRLAFIVDAETITGNQVDIVVLNTASEILKYQVRKHGFLFFDKNPAARKAFEIKSRKYFEDFLFLHKKYTNRVLYGRSTSC